MTIPTVTRKYHPAVEGLLEEIYKRLKDRYQVESDEEGYILYKLFDIVLPKYDKEIKTLMVGVMFDDTI